MFLKPWKSTYFMGGQYLVSLAFPTTKDVWPICLQYKVEEDSLSSLPPGVECFPFWK